MEEVHNSTVDIFLCMLSTLKKITGWTDVDDFSFNRKIVLVMWSRLNLFEI